MGSGWLDKLIDVASDSIYDIFCRGSESTGKRGERLTEKELNLLRLFGNDGKILRNLYLPKEEGSSETSETDLVFITTKGIFVIESKNYSGWIFGREQDWQWTASLSNGQKNKFYNPIKQNRMHINCIRRFVGESTPIHSLIVFSERCVLKKVTWESPDVEVINRDETIPTVRKIWDRVPDMVTADQVEYMYEKLLPYTQVSNEVKMQHVEKIQETQGRRNNSWH